MASSITTANGVVIVTQVFPLGETGKASVPLLNVTPQIQSAPPAMPLPTTKVSEMTRVFLQVQPQSLGIVQIILGLVCMVVSLSALLSPTLYDQAPLFMGVAFVLSGSLTVAARKGTGLSLIKGTLAVNIFSVLVALAGVAYICMLLTVKHEDGFCTPTDGNYTSDSNQNRIRECTTMVRTIDKVLNGVKGLLLVLTVMELCVALTVCVFSGKAIHLRGHYSLSNGRGRGMVVVETGTDPVRASQASLSDSDVALLGSAENSDNPAPLYSP
ncbi:membrane-spanning 4-domains subfamily A member 4A [Coregonus clupeaformis]|uniref:membrane-spanning 4-domains subfamily A member 4A n=1 Tax=Coregonus clupeaformis TaxID=59861 RepID=UPI001E1C28DA|nr:membrane-spanning 4-domains subfamily A member 4A [Coregonus clupeaformis]XP_045072852.1 membrane-spanning 4-domains subfamily A member 4A [Coregonus clupeaformis]